jgi:hypothetical protein
MPRRSLSILIAGIAALSALLLPAGREAHAEQAGSLGKTRDLNFGAFVPGTGIGTIVLSPAGARTPNGVVLLNSSAATSAAFSATVVAINGNNKGNLKSVGFSLPSSIQLTNGSGSSMTVDTFVSSPAAGVRSTIGLGSTVTVSVGATLRVSPNQPSGVYSGSFSVIADFQ